MAGKYYIEIRRVPMEGDTTIRFGTGQSYKGEDGKWRYRYVTRGRLVWPVLFDSRDAAEDYLTTCFTFDGIPGRKLSASVMWVR